MGILYLVLWNKPAIKLQQRKQYFALIGSGTV